MQKRRWWISIEFKVTGGYTKTVGCFYELQVAPLREFSLQTDQTDNLGLNVASGDAQPGGHKLWGTLATVSLISAFCGPSRILESQ